MIIGEPGPGTWCTVDGEVLALLGINGDGSIEVEGASVPADRVGGVFVEHEDEPGEVCRGFPQPAAFGDPLEPAGRVDAAAGLADALRRLAPEGWNAVRLDATALGTRIAVGAKVRLGDQERPWIPPGEVVEWLRRHRLTTYTPGNGAWTGLGCDIRPDGEAGITLASAPPQWLRERDDVREYHDELRYLPRVEAPDWLLERAGRHRERVRGAGAEPRGPVRMARLFDDRDDRKRPLVFRPVLPWAEKPMILDYLGEGAVVLSARSTSEDEVDPTRPPEVPKAYLTDGTWVWPLSMSYYLHHHNIAPPRDFLDHIRRRGHRAPGTVASHALEEAKALVLGTDVESLDGASTADALAVVKQCVGDLRVSKRSYSFERPVEGGWSMIREPDGWWSVFCVDEGERKNEARFPKVFEAGAHLVGCLTLTRSRFLREPDEVLEDHECPIHPVPEDPPIGAYDGKLIAGLSAGDEVDRFGTAEGNTVFVAGTTLPQRSMPPQEPPGEYRRYRVTTGFEVVSGLVRPDHGQVGGGTAFFLPQPVADLVAGGWLAEL